MRAVITQRVRGQLTVWVALCLVACSACGADTRDVPTNTPSLSPALTAVQDKPLTEKQKIEALIKHVEEMKDAKFVRNDTEYDAKSAAKFLRGKWEQNEAEVKTAKDFIDKVATASGTTGKPYLVRFKDKDVKSADYLNEQLKKIEKKNP